MVIRDAEPTENTDTEKNLFLAAPMDRLAAFIIDHLILLGPVISIFTAPFERQLKEAILIGDDAGAILSGSHMVLMGLSALIIYHSVFLRIVGGSLGQILMGLRVVQIWNQEAVGTWNSILRVLLWCLNFFLLGLPSLAVFSDVQRRTWYDRASDSVVVTTRKSRSILKPNIFHRSMTQGFLAALSVFMVLLMAYVFYSELGSFNQRTKIYSLLEEDDVLCGVVGEAQNEWPEERGRPANRVSVALALFLAGEVDVSCLEAEFDPRAFANQQDALARLSKSFIYSENNELSDLYLESVCEYEDKSDACYVAKSIMDHQFVNNQKLNDPENAAVYSQLWVLDQEVESGNFKEAQEYLDKIPALSWLSNVRSPAQAKIMWGQGDLEKSRGAAEVAFNFLKGSSLLDLSSWLCHEELSRSCESWDSSSCTIFKQNVSEVGSATEDLKIRTALTKYKKSECEQGSALNLLSLKKLKLPSEVEQFALAKLQNNRLDVLAIAKDENQHAGLRLEAMLSLLGDNAEEDEVAYALDAFSLSYFNQGKNQLGEALIHAFMVRRDYEKIVAIAKELNLNNEHLSSTTLESQIVAEYHLGRKIKAQDLLVKYQAQYPQNWVKLEKSFKQVDASRDIASVGNHEKSNDQYKSKVEDFELVVRSME